MTTTTQIINRRNQRLWNKYKRQARAEANRERFKELCESRQRSEVVVTPEGKLKGFE